MYGGLNLPKLLGQNFAVQHHYPRHRHLYPVALCVHCLNICRWFRVCDLLLRVLKLREIYFRSPWQPLCNFHGKRMVSSFHLFWLVPNGHRSFQCYRCSHANMSIWADVPIKNEVPDYPSFDSPAISPSLKRRRSDHSQDIGEKRQRLDHIAALSNPNMESPSIADLAAQASEAVMKQYLAANQDYTVQTEPSIPFEPTLPSTIHDTNVPAGSDFVSDPYLYMRIFSLPILESLVRYPRYTKNGIC